jgi:hypothetical protein
MSSVVILVVLIIFIIYTFAVVHGNTINDIAGGANGYISGIPSMGGFQLGSYDPVYSYANSIVRNP